MHMACQIKKEGRNRARTGKVTEACAGDWCAALKISAARLCFAQFTGTRGTVAAT